MSSVSCCSTLSISLSFNVNTSLSHSFSNSLPFPLTCLSFSSCTIQPPVCLSRPPPLSLCSSLLLLLPLGPSLSKCVAAQGLRFLSLREECCLTERSASKCDRRVKRQTCTRVHAYTHFFPAATCASLCSRALVMKLLRQILGRNSICRGDELCDRVQREERRMKGQEEKRSRVRLQG